ncbi:MAG: CopD family protein [Stellaceae bacterium]
MSGIAAGATIALILHILSAVVWVGGMFFAHQVLRPAVAGLDLGPRLMLWSRVLRRFFAWAFAAIVLLLASGFWMVLALFGGFATAGLYINLMTGLGILMMLLFLHIYFAPWRRFRQALARQDWAEGARRLGQIRMVVAINLVLGLITVAIGGSGRYWG